MRLYRKGKDSMVIISNGEFLNVNFSWPTNTNRVWFHIVGSFVDAT